MGSDKQVKQQDVQAESGSAAGGAVDWGSTISSMLDDYQKDPSGFFQKLTSSISSSDAPVSTGNSGAVPDLADAGTDASGDTGSDSGETAGGGRVPGVDGYYKQPPCGTNGKPVWTPYQRAAADAGTAGVADGVSDALGGSGADAGAETDLSGVAIETATAGGVTRIQSIVSPDGFSERIDMTPQMTEGKFEDDEFRHSTDEHSILTKVVDHSKLTGGKTDRSSVSGDLSQLSAEPPAAEDIQSAIEVLGDPDSMILSPLGADATAAATALASGKMENLQKVLQNLEEAEDGLERLGEMAEDLHGLLGTDVQGLVGPDGTFSLQFHSYHSDASQTLGEFDHGITDRMLSIPSEGDITASGTNYMISPDQRRGVPADAADETARMQNLTVQNLNELPLIRAASSSPKGKDLTPPAGNPKEREPQPQPPRPSEPSPTREMPSKGQDMSSVGGPNPKPNPVETNAQILLQRMKAFQP
jgi:hypothetical protein